MYCTGVLYDYPRRDQVILKCNINDSSFVISQVDIRWVTPSMIIFETTHMILDKCMIIKTQEKDSSSSKR